MKTIVTFISILMLTGCTTWSTSSIDSGNGGSQGSVIAGGEKKSPLSIIITKSDITDKKYKILGDIEVTVNKTTIFNKDPTREMVDKELKKEAAKLGADAVTFVRYGTVGMGLMSWGSLNGKGRAIAFIN